MDIINSSWSMVFIVMTVYGPMDYLMCMLPMDYLMFLLRLVAVLPVVLAGRLFVWHGKGHCHLRWQARGPCLAAPREVGSSQ